jgi:pyruvate/2-oxoglutarate dehydrogenase complex dihydrolipoamide dehydrogenase (E3) component
MIHEVFSEEGIEIVTSAHIAKVEGKSGEWVKLYAARDGAEIILEGTHLLVASGRAPNTQGIGLELAGVETTDRGYVKVNERLETTAPGVTTGRQVPFCMFTDPEFARIGLSEAEAKERGIAYRLAKIPIVAVLRTRTLSETRGFLKALIDTESDHILGFTALGAEAGEIIATVQVAMLAGLPYTVLRDAIFTHPTMLEGLIPLFSAVPPS